MRSLIVLCMAGILAAGCGSSATSSGARPSPPSDMPGSPVAVVAIPRDGVGRAIAHGFPRDRCRQD